MRDCYRAINRDTRNQTIAHILDKESGLYIRVVYLGSGPPIPPPTINLFP